MKHTSLTQNQKLEALKLKYYDDFQWEPIKGDYYTSCRNDLELYQIVDEDDDFFYTNYCDPQRTTQNPSHWPKTDFKKGFGEKRVFVPHFILEEITFK